MSDWSKEMAQKVNKQLLADRDESYAMFLREMATGVAALSGAAIPSVTEETMHRSYDIGYTDALNALLKRGALAVEKLL
jgi:hypothetical protein